ncbi:MAG: carboxypeptidase-like regulatory domain-containing protein, partial [Gemmatimonadota bacterium]|nr:carboxypeptidase-like regulatory domain-containing protein [Gemmatimonadota bacterium]
MTRISIFVEKVGAAAVALVLVAGFPQQLSAQPAAVIRGTVRNAVTEGPVANATVRVVMGRRVSVTGGDGSYRLVVDAGESEVRVTAVGFAPASQRVSLAPGASTVVAFVLSPSAMPLDDVVSVGGRAFDRTATASPVPVDAISGQLLDNTGMIETWQQLQRLVPSVNVPRIPLGDNHMRPVTLRGLA